MNKIEEYIKNLDTKNRVMLYGSVLFLFIIIYYNFNYNYLQKHIQANRDKIFLLQNSKTKTNTLKRKLVILKKTIKSLSVKNISLKQDLKYIRILINTDKVLNISDKKFLDILKQILQSASDNSISASYKISKQMNDYKIFSVDIKGNFNADNFSDFYKFIKSIESIKNIKIIKQLTFSDQKRINFEIVCEFWSIK